MDEVMSGSDNEPATRGDLRAVKGDLRLLSGELKGDMGALRSDFLTFRSEMRGDFATFRQELRDEIRELIRPITVIGRNWRGSIQPDSKSPFQTVHAGFPHTAYRRSYG